MASPLPAFGPELPFSTADLDACLKVAQCLADHPDLILAPWLRRLRKAIVPLVAKVETVKQDHVGAKRARGFDSVRRQLLHDARESDRAASQKCQLAAGRIAKLQRLCKDQDECTAVPLIPDGPVRDDLVQSPMATLTQQSTSTSSERELFYPRKCYVCQHHFTQLHEFYNQLCPPCAALNYAKRHQTANLHGKTALVTGARVKIGFFTALKLLQAGATVVVTTRFPREAMERYQREPQFEQFKDRLHIFGVDLHDLVHVHCLLDYVASAFTRLDIIIHNAAQTVRRPPQYYKPLIAKELALDCSQAISSPREAQPVLSHHAAFQSKICTSTERWRFRSLQPQTEALPVGNAVSHNNTIVHPVTMSSALKSQIPVLGSDLTLDLKAFPPGMVDVNGQQLDLRSTNSWIAQLGEVETPELAEVFTINAMAPFVINNRLLPMLERDVNANEPKFIINVSAMEGKFNRPKRANHPHTNMAKAALNMMTRTCASDLSRRRIYMNSVDTGWINDENPLHIAHKFALQNDFQTPLDEIDAAARVLDPIFSAVAKPETTPEYGSFLKDYAPTEW